MPLCVMRVFFFLCFTSHHYNVTNHAQSYKTHLEYRTVQTGTVLVMLQCWLEGIKVKLTRVSFKKTRIKISVHILLVIVYMKPLLLDAWPLVYTQ